MTLQIRSGCEGGGKGALIQENQSATLSTHNTQTLFAPVKAIAVDQRNQTAGNDKAETLHGVGHGSSVATVMQPIPIADKATRYKGGGDTRNDDGSANGLGVGEPGAPANTLTEADRHAVAYAIDRAAFNQGQNAQYNISIQEEVAQTLVAKGPGGYHIPYQSIVGPICARDYKGVGSEYVMEGKLIVEAMTENMGSKTYQEVTGPLMANSHPGSYTGQDAFSDMLVANDWEYIVRRLTPLECGRLQGFPDDWTEDIAIENPTASIIREWMIAWAEWWRIVGRAEGIQLPKDAKAVERWLSDPASDSGLYKMWGNGIALPCAVYVMEGIAMVLEQENQNEPE